MTTARAEAATSPAEDILVPCRDQQQQQGGDADADVVAAASSGFTTTPPTYLWFFSYLIELNLLRCQRISKSVWFLLLATLTNNKLVKFLPFSLWIDGNIDPQYM
jgi:hypothetical protein